MRNPLYPVRSQTCDLLICSTPSRPTAPLGTLHAHIGCLKSFLTVIILMFQGNTTLYTTSHEENVTVRHFRIVHILIHHVHCCQLLQVKKTEVSENNHS